MGTIQIGRLGYLGLGMETSPGEENTTPDVFLQYSANSLRGHHEPIEIVSSKTSRLMDKDSVVGKKWAEGDIEVITDVVGTGYLWKIALGNEVLETGTPNSHTFYTTVSGNAPKTATLILGRGDTDVEKYVYAAIDELSIEVSDGLAMMTASFQSKFPADVSAPTLSTTSGTHFSFKDMEVRFGANLSTAAEASATAVSDFSLTLANNLEVIHQSGSADVTAIRLKGFRASGSYTVFFDSETDKDAYYALNKRAMEIKFTGNSNEQLRIRIPEFRLSENDISTGLEDFYAASCEFVAEDKVDSGCRLIDVRLQNNKGTVY